MSIIISIVPDTPLNDAYHVGSFNLQGSFPNAGIENTTAANDGGRADYKPTGKRSDY